MTMFKLETMIYASEDRTYSVFTLNPDLQSGQMDDVVSVSGAPQIAQMVGSLAGSGRWAASRRRRMSSMVCGAGVAGIRLPVFMIVFLGVRLA